MSIHSTSSSDSRSSSNGRDSSNGRSSSSGRSSCVWCRVSSCQGWRSSVCSWSKSRGSSICCRCYSWYIRSRGIHSRGDSRGCSICGRGRNGWSNGRFSSSNSRSSNSNCRGTKGGRNVVSNNTETKVISNIVYSVDSSLILIDIRSSNSTKSISTLLLGTVDVIVAISNIAIFILSLELGADWASNRGSSNSSHWGSNSSHRGS